VGSPVILLKKTSGTTSYKPTNTTPPVWSRQDQREIRLQQRRAVSFHLDSLATSITVTVTAQTKEKENYIPNATSILFLRDKIALQQVQ